MICLPLLSTDHHMMSGKRGSNASLNLLEEKVIGNLMDCSKASIEFKGHRRAHSSGSQGQLCISYSCTM